MEVNVNSDVIRDPHSRYYVPEEDLPARKYGIYCAGASVIMTYAVLRELLRAASLISTHPTDDAYGFGDLALAVGIGHVELQQFMEWNENRTYCLSYSMCMLTLEGTKYGANSRRRGQWGLLFWHHSLVTGDSVDLSSRLEAADYRKMFQETRRKLSGR
ncbi:hypothetical protein V5799_026024 [Amblyomma americanum]|uniref:Uncharacterized protein n=1 Tax=Amblyomma americanum TaxID=6943 RepID=A0AAQ4DJR8_AMBAM